MLAGEDMTVETIVCVHQADPVRALPQPLDSHD